MIKGDHEEAHRSIELYQPMFARSLGISEQESLVFCLHLVSLSLLLRQMKPILKENADKDQWETWMQGLWGKEDQ